MRKKAFFIPLLLFTATCQEEEATAVVADNLLQVKLQIQNAEAFFESFALVSAKSESGETLGAACLTIDQNGNAESFLTESENGDQSASKLLLADGTKIVLETTLDRNGNLMRKLRADENDLKGEMIVTVSDEPVLIDAGELSPISGGFNRRELEELIALTREHSQEEIGRLSTKIENAMEMVRQNPSLLEDAYLSSFLSQDAVTAALFTCTTVSRYLFLRALEVLHPDWLKEAVPDFENYYIDAINSGYVQLGVSTSAYCYAAGGGKLAEDYIHEAYRSDLYLTRTDYPGDSKLIAALTQSGVELAVVREGPANSGGVHSFLVILMTDGSYAMLDTYNTEYSGRTLSERFNLSSDRRIWRIESYIIPAH